MKTYRFFDPTKTSRPYSEIQASNTREADKRIAKILTASTGDPFSLETARSYRARWYLFVINEYERRALETKMTNLK